MEAGDHGIEISDDRFAQPLGAFGRRDEDEVVAPDMAEEVLNANYIVASFLAQGFTVDDIVVTRGGLTLKDELRRTFRMNLDAEVRMLEGF